jgi:autotransporter translocation and assembly factor TamB
MTPSIMDNRRNKWTRLLRLLVIGAFLVVCVAILTVLLATSPAGEAYLTGILEAELSKKLQQQVSIQALETDLFTRIHLKDVRITRTEDLEAHPILQIGDLKLEYRLLKLLQKDISISSISISNVNIILHRDNQGLYNIAWLDSMGKAPSDTTKGSWKITLGSVSMNNLSMDYSDSILPLTVNTHNLSAKAQRLDPEGYRYEFTIDSINAEYQGLPFSLYAIESQGQWVNQKLHLDTLAGKLGDLYVTTAGTYHIHNQSATNGRLVITGNPGSLLQTVSQHFEAPAITARGDIDLHMRYEGSVDNPLADIRLLLPPVDVGNLQIQRAYLNARLHDDSVTVDSLNFRVFDGTLRAQANLSLDTLHQSRANLSITRLDLSALWSTFYGDESPYKGTVSGNLSVSGRGRRIRDWTMTTDLRASNAKYRAQPLPDFYAKLSLSKGLARLRIHESDFNIEANAQVANHRISGNFTIDIDQLEPVMGFCNVSELQGTLHASGTISGTTNSPSIQTAIHADNIQYQNFPVDSLKATCQFQDRRLLISQLRAAGRADTIDRTRPPFHLNGLSGGYRYTLNASGPLDSIQASMRIKFLHTRYRTFNADSAIVMASISGKNATLDTVELYRDSLLARLQGNFHLSTKKGAITTDLYDLAISAQAAAETESDDGLHQREQPQLVGTLTANVEISDPKRMSLSLRARRLDVHRITGSISESLDIGGKLQFDVDVSGNLAHPDARMSVNIQNPRFQMVTLDSMTAFVQFKNDSLRLHHLRCYSGDQQLTTAALINLWRDSTGRYTVSSHSPTQGSVGLHSIDLQILKPFLNEQWELTGRTSVNLTWDGTLESLNPQGWIAIEDCRLLLRPNTSPIEHVNIRVAIQDSLFNIQTATGSIHHTPFTLAGSIITSEWKRIVGDLTFTLSDIGSVTGKGTISPDSLNVEAQIRQLDLALLQPFITYFNDLSGKLNCTAALSGSIADPELFGDLDVRDLTFRPVPLSDRFEAGVIKLHFGKNTVYLDSLFARMNGGTVIVQGVLGYDRMQIHDMDITAVINELSVSRPKTYLITVISADLNCKKQKEYFLLNGDIQFGDSRLTAKFRPQSILPWAQKVDRPKSELSPFLQKIQMDIRVRESDKLWVDNNLAHIRMHGELAVIGSPARPNLSGRITIEEGYLVYLDRKFKVTRGEFYFANPTRFNPEVNLSTETKVTNYQGTIATPYVINLDVEGPLDEIRVNIYSEPALEKSDIVSLLTFGQTRSQLTGTSTDGGEGGIKNAIVERAGALSSQKISGYVTRKVGTFLGLDQVTVEGNLFRFNRSWGPQLLASKRISDRVELTYSTTVGYINDQSIRLDYLLSRHFSVEGQTDQRGQSSMNLKYRLRFR